MIPATCNVQGNWERQQYPEIARLTSAALPFYLRKSSAFPLTWEISFGRFAAGGRAASNRLNRPAKQSFAANRWAKPEVTKGQRNNQERGYNQERGS